MISSAFHRKIFSSFWMKIIWLKIISQQSTHISTPIENRYVSRKCQEDKVKIWRSLKLKSCLKTNCKQSGGNSTELQRTEDCWLVVKITLLEEIAVVDSAILLSSLQLVSLCGLSFSSALSSSCSTMLNGFREVYVKRIKILWLSICGVSTQ